MERQDKTRLFVGGFPKSFEDARRKLVLSGGASASNFARGRRNIDPIVSRDKMQFFEDRSVLGAIYQERMYKEPDTKQATELTRKLIQTIKSSRKSRLSFRQRVFTIPVFREPIEIGNPWRFWKNYETGWKRMHSICISISMAWTASAPRSGLRSKLPSVEIQTTKSISTEARSFWSVRFAEQLVIGRS